MYSKDYGIQFGWSSADFANPTYEDYLHNGKNCKGGIAFPLDENTARCALTDNIQFDGKTIDSPYQCDPTDNSKMCQIHFNITDFVPGEVMTTNHVDTMCRCAMDGDNGYCGQVLGTEEYKAYVASLLPVYRESACHTLDRDSLLAQKDVCGIGKTDVWREAVTLEYNVNQWPYVNAKKETKDCFEMTLRNSLTNLSKDSSLPGLFTSTLSFVTIFLVAVF